MVNVRSTLAVDTRVAHVPPVAIEARGGRRVVHGGRLLLARVGWSEARLLLAVNERLTHLRRGRASVEEDVVLVPLRLLNLLHLEVVGEVVHRVHGADGDPPAP